MLSHVADSIIMGGSPAYKSVIWERVSRRTRYQGMGKSDCGDESEPACNKILRIPCGHDGEEFVGRFVACVT